LCCFTFWCPLRKTRQHGPNNPGSVRIHIALLPDQSNANEDWDVRDILGKDIDGEVYYLVDWRPTLVPEHPLENAKELVDEFKARLRAQREPKNGRGRPSLKQGDRAMVGAEASGKTLQKRRRGRPRKEACEPGSQQPS